MNNKRLFLLTILLLLGSCSDPSPKADDHHGRGHKNSGQQDDTQSSGDGATRVEAIRAVSGIANIGNTCWANAAHQFILVNPCMTEMATHQLMGHHDKTLSKSEDIAARTLVQSRFKSLMEELKAGTSPDAHERRSRELLDAVSRLNGFKNIADNGLAKIGDQLDSQNYLRFLLKLLEYESTSCRTRTIRLSKSDDSKLGKPSEVYSKMISHKNDIAKEDDLLRAHPKKYEKFHDLAKSLLIQFPFSDPRAFASSLTLSVHKADDKELHLKSAIIHRPGHYYSLVRHKDDWFKLNDRCASSITSAAAMNEIEAASMVLYVEKEFL